MLIPLIAISWICGDFNSIQTFNEWNDVWFLLSFLSSCFMGFLLMYATFLCTQHNSPLTTTIVGCLKNILVTYVGMYLGGDYVFSFTNFLGLNISMVGSLIYSYITFTEKERKQPHFSYTRNPWLVCVSKMKYSNVSRMKYSNVSRMKYLNVSREDVPNGSSVKIWNHRKLEVSKKYKSYFWIKNRIFNQIIFTLICMKWWDTNQCSINVTISLFLHSNSGDLFHFLLH